MCNECFKDYFQYFMCFWSIFFTYELRLRHPKYVSWLSRLMSTIMPNYKQLCKQADKAIVLKIVQILLWYK